MADTVIHWPTGDCKAIDERRRIAALLREAGWYVNDKRVERLWRREGLKVPYKQPKRGRLWFNPSRGCASQTTAGQWMGRVFG